MDGELMYGGVEEEKRAAVGVGLIVHNKLSEQI